MKVLQCKIALKLSYYLAAATTGVSSGSEASTGVDPGNTWKPSSSATYSTLRHFQFGSRYVYEP